MRPSELLILYVLLGAAVSVAQWRLHRPAPWLSLALWPLFLPGLLMLSFETREKAPISPDGRIERAIRETREAFDGWTELPVGLPPLGDIEARLVRLAGRVARIEGVLAEPGCDPKALEQALAAASGEVRPLVQARMQHMARLRTIGDQSRSDLEQALAALSEIATRAQVARFTGDEVESVARDLVRLARMVDAAGEG